MITTGLAEDLMTDFELTEASLETPDWYDVDGLLAYALVTIAVLIAEAAAFCVMVFGHVGQGIAVLVGPLFIPWMIIPRFNRIFFGWLMVFIGFALYPIVAAGVMEMIANVGSHMFVFNGQTGVLTEILATPVIFVVSIALIYAIFKIPAMSHMLVSGVGHSDFGELLAGFVLRAFL